MMNQEEKRDGKRDEEKHDDWTPVVSKKSVKKSKQVIRKEHYQRMQKENDLRYLRTHVGFQSCRIRNNDHLGSLLEKAKHTVFVIGHGRCRGHVFDIDLYDQTCLECDWNTKDLSENHCCCSKKTLDLLPCNFYLGCNGLLNDYLVAMRDQEITLASL
jgi:hypothetical protein